MHNFLLITSPLTWSVYRVSVPSWANCIFTRSAHFMPKTLFSAKFMFMSNCVMGLKGEIPDLNVSLVSHLPFGRSAGLTVTIMINGDQNETQNDVNRDGRLSRHNAIVPNRTLFYNHSALSDSSVWYLKEDCGEKYYYPLFDVTLHISSCVGLTDIVVWFTGQSRAQIKYGVPSVQGQWT